MAILFKEVSESVQIFDWLGQLWQMPNYTQSCLINDYFVSGFRANQIWENVDICD